MLSTIDRTAALAAKQQALRAVMAARPAAGQPLPEFPRKLDPKPIAAASGRGANTDIFALAQLEDPLAALAFDLGLGGDLLWALKAKAANAPVLVTPSPEETFRLERALGTRYAILYDVAAFRAPTASEPGYVHLSLWTIDVKANKLAGHARLEPWSDDLRLPGGLAPAQATFEDITRFRVLYVLESDTGGYYDFPRIVLRYEAPRSVEDRQADLQRRLDRKIEADKKG